jgi:hypothetical protein
VTQPSPAIAGQETGSARSRAPSAIAVTGLSARKTATPVGGAWANAQSQRT